MKDAIIARTQSAVRLNALQCGILARHPDEARAVTDAIEADVCAARRTPAFGWLGLLALVGPWFAAALLWSALNVG